MEGVPTRFQSISPIIGSYDWLDLTSGTGYRRYYPIINDISAGATYILSSKVLDASSDNYILSAIVPNGGVNTKVIDADFDITINVPAIIGGVFYTNFTHKLEDDGNLRVHWVMDVKHVTAAGVETSLGTATSPNRARTAGSVTYKREFISGALTNHVFAKGDKLRLTVEGWGDGYFAGTKIWIYVDPANQVTFTDTATRTVGTDLILDLPFKVSL